MLKAFGCVENSITINLIFGVRADLGRKIAVEARPIWWECHAENTISEQVR
jgi:hypothetical protein